MSNILIIDAKSVFYKHFENNKKVVNGHKLEDFINIIVKENDIDH